MNYFKSSNKTVFIILLILVGSFTKAIGTKMAFTKTLITLMFLFSSYAFIAKKKKEMKLTKSKQTTEVKIRLKKILLITWNVGYVLVSLIVIAFYKALVQEGQGLLFRKTLLIGFIWFVICLVTYELAGLIVQKYKINSKVIHVFGWANLISWVIGSIGLIIAILTIVFVQLIPKKQRTFFDGLAYTNIFLSVCNMIAGIFTANLYYVGLVGWTIMFIYTLVAIAIYMFFVRPNRKKTKTKTDPVTNTLEDKYNYVFQLNKQTFLIIVIVFISMCLGLFYWLEIRPVVIRRSCSWVKTIEPSIPARTAMTEDELRQQGLLEDCSTQSLIDKYYQYKRIKPYSDGDNCNKKNQLTIEKYSKPQDEIPEKEVKREATEKEYQSCLRHNGLE